MDDIDAAQRDTTVPPRIDGDSPPSAPRWLKAFGVITIVLVLAVIGLHLSGNAPQHTPFSGGGEHGMQLP